MTRWSSLNKTKTSKYGNTIIDTPDGKFHSKREYARWQELKLESKARQIILLERQKTYRLEVNGVLICKWIVDFDYSVVWIKENGDAFRQPIVEDLKGMQTRISKLKVKLFKALYPNIEVRITG